MQSEYIETRDRRLYIIDTRVLVRNVYDVHNSGVSLEKLADQWDVEIDALDAALETYEAEQEEIEERREQEKKGTLFGSTDQATVNEGAD